MRAFLTSPLGGFPFLHDARIGLGVQHRVKLSLRRLYDAWRDANPADYDSLTQQLKSVRDAQYEGLASLAEKPAQSLTDEEKAAQEGKAVYFRALAAQPMDDDAVYAEWLRRNQEEPECQIAMLECILTPCEGSPSVADAYDGASNAEVEHIQSFFAEKLDAKNAKQVASAPASSESSAKD